MKIIVNYDLIDKIKDVNEPLNIFKLIRNNKYMYLTYHLPIFILTNYFIFQDNVYQQMMAIPMQYLASFSVELYSAKKLGVDRYHQKAELKLMELSHLLNEINIRTDYELLLESEVYDKKYKIRLNEKKLPEIVESKYIMIQTRTFTGDTKDTSIEQEHVVGSKEYILSLGSPNKEFKLAYSSI